MAFENHGVVIDGTITAVILDGEIEIGRALLVFPTYGVSSHSEETLSGLSLFCGVEGKDYTIRFETVKLWAIEE